MVSSFAVVALLAGAASALPGRSPFIQAQDRTKATGRVLVQVDGQANTAAYKAAIDRVLKETGLAGAKDLNRFDPIGAFAISGKDAARLTKVRDHKLVALAAESVKVAPVASQTRVVDDKLWGLDRVDNRPLNYDGKITLNGDGEGVDVYVIDTGVNVAHEQFEGRATNYWTAYPEIDGKPNPNGTAFEDKNGHGTHCSGTVAGKTTGVAPKAKIFAVRVLGDSGSGSTEGVIAGMLSLLNRKDKTRPAIASMSLGGPRESDIESKAVDALVADNVVVTVAAGNSNADACAHTPAFAENAITVGAADVNDQIASFSNWGTCVDIFAPGVDIYSAYNGATDAYDTLSGTSMATPHVAGVLAVLRSQYPGLTVDEIKKIIYGLATPNIITGIRTCPQTTNLNAYAKFDDSMFVSKNTNVTSHAECASSIKIQSRSSDKVAQGVWIEKCEFKGNNKCKSISPVATDAWCDNVKCDAAYSDFCSY